MTSEAVKPDMRNTGGGIMVPSRRSVGAVDGLLNRRTAPFEHLFQHLQHHRVVLDNEGSVFTLCSRP
jgi:hypothetical protein